MIEKVVVKKLFCNGKISTYILEALIWGGLFCGILYPSESPLLETPKIKVGFSSLISIDFFANSKPTEKCGKDELISNWERGVQKFY